MQDKGGLLGLILTSTLCVCAVLAGALYISGKTEVFSISKDTVSEYIISVPKDSITAENSSAVAVNGNKIGTVTPKFISPYNSNTYYNRVYINNKTDVPLNVSELLSAKNPVNIEKCAEPEVLIIHTHATECYLPESRDYYTDTDLSRTTDNSKNTVAIGEVISKKLNNAGIKTINDSTAHDYPSYSGSYNRSKTTVEKYLKEYPSIKVVIDLHRDSIGTNGAKTKPLVTINGKKAAQVMLVMGCGAKMDDHKNWKQNMIFAVKYQQTMEVLYPGLARSMCFLNSKYNQNLSVGSILLEVGTDANSFEEAVTGAEFAADALIAYLNTL
ncbi:MAG: hypothetical protein E7568_03405 [Ruminococcaceae bacterium]|nr:hypothetical protein [Oscillospiraceae bacterium]